MKREMFLQFNSTSEVYKQYCSYQNLKEKINNVYFDFARQMGLEGTEVAPNSNNLLIVATSTDIENYNSQLCKPAYPNTRCLFEKNSFINKAWKKIMKSFKIKSFPKPTYESCMPSLLELETEFAFDGCVFIRATGDLPLVLPQGCKIISGIDFYQALEDMDNDNNKKTLVA